jgi:cytidine deaminase
MELLTQTKLGGIRMTDLELYQKAVEQLKNSYAPYSKFAVGAALLTEEGNLYTGCNIESAAYSATICAERTALVKSVSEGDLKIASLAVASSSGDFTFPCGICRQMLVEFNPNLRIIVGNQQDQLKVFLLKELLPEAFTAQELDKN